MTILDPGSDDWMKYMTASKVAAVLGMSPYTSPLMLWARMKGIAPQEPGRPEMARGHFLEPAILAWFFDRHPEFERAPAGTYYVLGEQFAANPDGVAVDDGVAYPVEAKSANDLTEWGEPGTDEIPVHYALQCVWTMYVMDADRIYVPMLGPFLQFNEYVVYRNRAVESVVVEQCRGFMESLKRDVPPPLSDDVRMWTDEYETLRKIHPDIDKSKSVQVPLDFALACITSRGAEDHAKAMLLELMGDAAEARCGELLIARRTSRLGGTPFLAWPKKPIDPDLLRTT